ncbi:MAG: GAF domain-containing protein [Anaerolineae bacterium]|nr:GAF domain-containing protein [Anaerolineae bacterium]
MKEKLLLWLHSYWNTRSLREKLRTLVSVLMVILFLGSILAFTLSTRLTQTQYLEQQAIIESNRVIEALNIRVQNLDIATGLLAQDPQIALALQDDTEKTLSILNSRAVAMRERFDIDLIQIYNAQGVLRTNLLLSNLYRESAVLDDAGTGQPVLSIVDAHPLILDRAEIPDGGTVVLGIDLDTEFGRLLSQYRLSSDLGMQIDEGIFIGTSEDFPLDKSSDRKHHLYSKTFDFSLCEVPLKLILARPITDIQQIMTTGILVMVISTIITTSVLITLGINIINAVVRPIQQLSDAAAAVARGNLTQKVNITNMTSWLKIGDHDEIGLLATTFNTMVDELYDLYENLETKVTARTQELATTAEIARTISSSLNLDVLLSQVVRVIRKQLSCDHIGIFVVDERTEQLVLRAMDGEVGQWCVGEQISLHSNTLMGAAMALHSPCVIQDLTTDLKYLETPWLEKTRAAIAVPLLTEKAIIGVLEVQNYKIATFTPDTMTLLTTLSDQVAMGIRNAQLYHSEQQRRQFAEALEHSWFTLSNNCDALELPGQIMSVIKSIVPYERGSLWVQQDDILKPVAQYGYVDERPMLHLARPVHNSDIFQALVDMPYPLHIEDTTRQHNWQHQLWLPGDPSWMGVPIISKGFVIGIISLIRAHPFNNEEAVLVQSLALQASIALENVALHAQVAELRASWEHVPSNLFLTSKSLPKVDWIEQN